MFFRKREKIVLTVTLLQGVKFETTPPCFKGINNSNILPFECYECYNVLLSCISHSNKNSASVKIG